jgi:hypothetical protein
MSDVVTIIKEFIREHGWLLVLTSLLLSTLVRCLAVAGQARGLSGPSR